MKLDANIVRDVMLLLEANLESSILEDGSHVSNSIMLKNIYTDENLCSKYLSDDIRYATLKLYEAGYITARKKCAGREIIWMEIYDITFKGHEFLNSIRDADVFSKIMSVLDGTGTVSLDILSDVAKTLMTQFIKSKLGIKE